MNSIDKMYIIHRDEDSSKLASEVLQLPVSYQPKGYFTKITGVFPVLLGLLMCGRVFGMPAFPGAQGGGAGSLGGRGGGVYEVTNLNDAGAGSLRAGVQMSGARTIVFRVGGTIKLLTELDLVNPYLTIAGQTAPGGGILLSGVNLADQNNMVRVRTHDVILKYMRIRTGYGVIITLNSGTGISIEGGGV